MKGFSLTQYSGMIRRFLQVQPSELKFPFELNKLCTCSIKLINKTDQDVAFKVKTTHPKKYCVRPNLGVISPGSTCFVEVTMQAQKVAPIGVLRKDKFLVQSIIAQNGEKFRGVTSDMFRNETRNDFQEYKLRVVFVSANPPSPIPEVSEEGSSSEASELENADTLSCRKSLFNNVAEALDDCQHRLREACRSARDSQEDSEVATVGRDKRLQDWAVISKLMEERSIALFQNRELKRQLEMLRKQRRQHSINRSSLICWLLFIVISLLVGYAFGYVKVKPCLAIQEHSAPLMAIF